MKIVRFCSKNKFLSSVPSLNLLKSHSNHCPDSGGDVFANHELRDNREFKKPRRRRRGQRRLKNELYFSYKYRDTLKSFSLFLSVKTISKLNLEHSDKFEIEI